MIKLNYSNIKKLLNKAKNRPILQAIRYRTDNLIEFTNSYAAVRVYDKINRKNEVLININTLKQIEGVYPNLDRLMALSAGANVTSINVTSKNINNKDVLLYVINEEKYFNKNDVDILFNTINLKFNKDLITNLYLKDYTLIFKTDAIHILQLGLRIKKWKTQAQTKKSFKAL